MTIYPFGISEAGRNIAEHSEGPQAASTAESTALPSGIGKNSEGIASPCPPVDTEEILPRVCQRGVGNRELPPGHASPIGFKGFPDMYPSDDPPG
jgi:hypothetical protein